MHPGGFAKLEKDASSGWKKYSYRAAFLLTALLVAMAPAAMSPEITSYYFRTEDAPAAVFVIAGLVLFAGRSPKWRLPAHSPETRTVFAIALVLAALCWLGTHLIMLDYPLTRDEHMVAFDGGNFAAGRLGSKIPIEWWGYSLALVPNFLLVTPDYQVLASSYLPGNAALRAGFAQVADPALLNPLLAALGLVALHRISLRLFGRDSSTIWIVLGGYVLSAQIAVNAMTHYAMTAHLVLNLAWLLLFLRGGAFGHACAMAVGILAIGIHQPIFHPLFAGPFILWLAMQRRWMLFTIYSAVYAAAMVFWLSWLSIIVQSVDGVIVEGSSAAGPVGFVLERVLPLVSRIDTRMPALMAANGLRGLVWNAAFVVPLLLIAVGARRRLDPIALCLLSGVAATLLAMAILLPHQGHGWGYRYIHGVIGSILLLAGYGWEVLSVEERKRRQGSVIALAAATLAVGTFQVWQAHRFVTPHAALASKIGQSKAEFVIVDTDTTRAAIDQVRNRADLSNRPLVFSSGELEVTQAAELCRRGSVAVVGEDAFRRTGFFAGTTGSKATRFAELTEMLEKGACLVPASDAVR
jgi:hypothetical protein